MTRYDDLVVHLQLITSSITLSLYRLPVLVIQLFAALPLCIDPLRIGLPAAGTAAVSPWRGVDPVRLSLKSTALDLVDL
jgi:hypothetical protein